MTIGDHIISVYHDTPDQKLIEQRIYITTTHLKRS